MNRTQQSLQIVRTCLGVGCLLAVHFNRELAAASEELFPGELVCFTEPNPEPIFTGEGPGHWDAAIRERGWILHEGNQWRMWFTGYDGTRPGIKLLGYATSPDGLHWQREPKPIYDQGWIEDMTVI